MRRLGAICVVALVSLTAVRAEEDPDAESAIEELRRRESALAANDAEGRAALAAFAWSRRLDDEARDLARAAIALDADHEAAHRLLAHVSGGDEWKAGWPAAWPAVPHRAKSSRSTKAIHRALAWLAAHQDEDGRIDADGFSKHCPEDDACPDPGGGHHGERVPCGFDGVVTALAVMAWMAEGSTSTSGPHAESVSRGIAFCRTTVRGAAGFDAIWNVAFATQALADACAATRSLELRPVVATAVERLIGEQRADGGWSYVYSIGDVPTTAAVLVALGLAAQAGIGIDSERIARALAFLEKRVDAESGRSEYHDGAERKGYTPTTANAAATLAARGYLGVLGKTRDKARRFRAVTAKKPRWKLEFKEVKTQDGRKVRAQVGNLYPYAWYCAALATAARGGGSGSAWLKGLAGALRSGQAKTGHAAGSWEPLGPYSLSGGRAFVTALGALMLQAEYRYPRRR